MTNSLACSMPCLIMAEAPGSGITLGANTLRQAFIDTSDAIGEGRDELSRLDGAAGDGDLGATLAVGFRAVRDVLEAHTYERPADVLREVGLELGRRAPSTLGTLLASAFRKASDVAGPRDLDAAGLADVLAAAADAVRLRGEVELGQRTVLDAMSAGAEAARQSAEAQADVVAALEAAALGAARGAEATAGMKPMVGRAAWVGDRARGIPDAGAVAWALILRSVAASVARHQVEGAS